MPDHEPNSPVTLEELLRLKRAERPSAEFWTGFERELRQKQLAALLERRPWWQQWSRWAWRHAYLPLGATAALAFAFVTIQNQGSSPLSTGETVPTMTGIPEKELVQAIPEATPPPVPDSSPVVAVLESVAAEPTPAIAATLPGDVGEMIPWSAPRVAEESPSARSIAETLAQIAETNPELLESVRGNRLTAPAVSRAQPERVAMELASVSVATETPRRSNRLLAGYEEREFMREPSAPDSVRERIARRLGDPDLFDEVRRLDLKGDRLSLKL